MVLYLYRPVHKDQGEKDMHLIPMPKDICLKEGTFDFTYKTSLKVTSDPKIMAMARELQEHIKEKLAFNLDLKAKMQGPYVCFEQDDTDHTYEIEINPACITIRARDHQGMFYGLQTLKQLIGLYKRHLPCLVIHDQADFDQRGFYHDVTRGKVPTLKQLKNLVDLMASFKLNQLQLYIEHTYLFTGQSESWTNTDPLTAEEIMSLDDYCKDKYIELVPSIATFGHLYEVLQTQTYNHLSEIGPLDGFSFEDRMDHHTLDVSQGQSLDLVRAMIDDFIPLVASHKFNICADETFDLGEGKNKALAQEIGKSKMYVDFLNEIISHVKSHGKEVMFWGDIILKHPEHIKDLPKDLICLNWWYWLNYPEEKVKAIHDNGFRQYMCPGVNGWNTLMNNHKMAYDNISMMAQYGRKYRVEGILNTDWGDYGHWNALSNSIPGLIYGSAFSWGENRSYEALNTAIDHVFYECQGLMAVLHAISSHHHFTLLEWVQWFEKDVMTFADRIDVTYEDMKVSQACLDSALENLQDMMCQCSPAINHHLMTYIVSAEAVKLMNDLYGLLQVHVYKKTWGPTVKAKDLAVKWEYWLLDFKKLWYKDNKASEVYRVVDFIKATNLWLRNL